MGSYETRLHWDGSTAVGIRCYFPVEVTTTVVTS